MVNYVHCQTSDGPRPGFLSVGVDSVEGYTEFLAIEERFLWSNGKDWYLPVAVVGKDSTHKTTLVELPLEADSGAKRVWVHDDAVTANPHEVLA